MDWRIDLVAIPVTDVDRAKAFCTGQVGFHADHDYQVSDTHGSCSSPRRQGRPATRPPPVMAWRHCEPAPGDCN
jgi:hypothetical protein